MSRRHLGLAALSLLVFGHFAVARAAEEGWRYYRPGNTGIQGDFIDALWVGPDGDPYIGGHDPFFEEGGFVKFVQSENRWINYSNVDFPIIGHPNETGCTRVRDIVPDATGKLWLATWHGALTFDPAVGAASLTRLGPGNSGLIDEQTYDVDRAPDDTMWFVNGGIARYNPASDTWTRWQLGEVFLSVQPKSGGGYLVWSSTRPPFQSYTFIFDSATQQWTTIDVLYPNGSPGDVAGLPGKDCVDDAGNLWALRLRNPGDFDALHYRQSNGTWVTPIEPYYGVTYEITAFKAYGNGKALLADGKGEVFEFNGAAWVSLGVWRPGGSASVLDVDAGGNVWIAGVGGAAKRNAQTGTWQRYRVTNTANYDSFNRDLTIDPVNGYVYAGANAAPGVGGMTRFDGQRWVGWNNANYGLGYDWNFGTDYCDALAYRPSNGNVAVCPGWMYGIHEWTGLGFNTLQPTAGAERLCEDSQGRLWALGEYFSLSFYTGGTWHDVPIVGWGAQLRPDPTRPGTVWTMTGSQVLRTDGGAYNFSRTVGDFPELTENSDTFLGIAVDADGVAWIGASNFYGGPTPGGALIRIDADTGQYQMFTKSGDWPFPGDTVTPWAVTPDHRVWMQYDDSNYPYEDMGLCWYDGTATGAYPAPPGGEPQWGGLPHRQIEDMEVRVLPDAYELWMSCVSRGIAVLTVPLEPPVAVHPDQPPLMSLEQNYPNPFAHSTQLGFSIPQAEEIRLDVYDVRGRLVRTLASGTEPAGRHELVWDGKDTHNRAVPSGVYFYKLYRGGQQLQRKMVLLR